MEESVFCVVFHMRQLRFELVAQLQLGEAPAIMFYPTSMECMMLGRAWFRFALIIIIMFNGKMDRKGF